MSQESITQLIQTYFKHLESLNPQGISEYFAEDASIYDPVGNPPSKPEDFQQFIFMLSQLFQELKITQEHLFLVGNQGAVKWTMNVVSKTKKTAQAEGISTFEINEAGKIQKICAYWDDKALMTQLKGG